MSTIVIGSQISVIANKTGSLYMAEDTMHNRRFLPIFTSSTTAESFRLIIPNNEQYSVVVFDTLQAFTNTVAEVINTLARQFKVDWIAINHPGPNVPQAQQLHVRSLDLVSALSKNPTEVHVDY